MDLGVCHWQTLIEWKASPVLSPTLDNAVKDYQVNYSSLFVRNISREQNKV